MADPEVSILISAKDLASKALKNVGKTGKTLSAGLKKAFKAIGIAALAGSVAIVGGMTKAVTAFAAFEKGIAEVTTLADFSADQIKAMSAETLDFSVAFNQATDALNKARYDTVSAGFASMAEQTLIMTEASKAAVAGVSDVATTTDLLTTVLNAYQLSASDAARINDLLFTTVKVGKTTIDQMAASWGNMLPAANAAGIALEDVGASFGVMTAAGISSSESATALVGLFNKLAAATPESKLAMEELGISIRGSNGELLAMEDILRQFVGLDFETIKRIFPDESASKAMLSLTANFEKFKKSAEEFDPQKMVGAVDESFEKMTNTIDFQLGQLGKRWDAFWISILQGDAGEQVTKALKDLNTWFDENKESVEKLTQALADFVTMLVDSVAPAIEIINDLISALDTLRLLEWTPKAREQARDLKAALDPAGASLEVLERNMGKAKQSSDLMSDSLRETTQATAEYNLELELQEQALLRTDSTITDNYNPALREEIIALNGVETATEAVVTAQGKMTTTLETYDAVQPGVDTMQEFTDGMFAGETQPAIVMSDALDSVTAVVSSFNATGLGQ
ncbi:MAG: phage tail tape measure protein, partial [Thiotrichaceae bacterium]